MSVLPDGLFLNQKSQFGKILEGLVLEDVGIFRGHFVYFTAKWYILWSFGIYFLFWYDVPRKIWQPWSMYNFDVRNVYIFVSTISMLAVGNLAVDETT
jgi:hypothetical protein